MLAEVPADRLRPCVETPLSEGAAQLADQLCHRVGDLGRRRVGTPRAGLERRVALDAPAGHQTGHPRPRHPVLASGVRVGSPLHNNSHNHQTSLRHGPTLKAPGRFLGVRQLFEIERFRSLFGLSGISPGSLVSPGTSSVGVPGPSMSADAMTVEKPIVFGIVYAGKRRSSSRLKMSLTALWTRT